MMTRSRLNSNFGFRPKQALDVSEIVENGRKKARHERKMALGRLESEPRPGNVLRQPSSV